MTYCEHKITNVVEQDKLIVCQDCGEIVGELDSIRIEIRLKIWDLLDELEQKYTRKDIMLALDKVSKEYTLDLKQLVESFKN